MIYKLRVFAFYFQVLQKVCVCVGWGQGKEEESKHRRNPRDILRVKIIPLESFLTLFLIFSFVRCKNNEKNSFKKQNHNIYNTSIWQLPLYILKKVIFLSTCTNYFNTWSFYDQTYGIENFLEHKSWLEGSKGVFFFFFLFLNIFKRMNVFAPREKKLVF